MMNLTLKNSRFFSGFFKKCYNEDIIKASLYSTPSFSGASVAPSPFQYQTTKLGNGITVLTESGGIPSTVQIGIFVNVGTRDETAENSGACHSLSNTYLKTAITTSETVNYGITQMAGGEFEVEFNRENFYYRASCLSHDVIDVFSMAVDCAFQPKNYVSASVGVYKNDQALKLEGHLGGNETFNDQIYEAAFGKKNLGMPLLGNRSNVNNLSVYNIQKFQSDHLTPSRVLISGAGIENHNEFVDLVQEKFAYTQLAEKSAEREKSAYIGGEARNLTDSNNIHVVFAFEGATHANHGPLRIAQQILGQNRRSGRIQKNILSKHIFIDNVQPINANYADSGLFGLKLSGSAAHAKDIVNVGIQELTALRTITPAEFETAKQTFKGHLSRHYTSNWRRLEDRTKSLFYLGRTFEDYSAQIDSITLEQVQAAVTAALKTPLTFVVKGGQATHLPSYDALTKQFN